jgi:predicted ATP-dependent endonuclease of OLD family
MFIKFLSIRNFRNFRSVKFSFVESSVNTILGENASGKTNAFHAMRLVLDDSLPLNARFLTTDDFNRELGQVRGHWIVISFTFGGLGTSDEELVLANHILEGDKTALEGTYTFIYRPKYHIRQKMYEISSSQPAENTRLQLIEAYLQTIVISKECYEAVGFARTTVDFSDDAVYEKLAGNFKTGMFPDPQYEDAELIGEIKPAYFSLIIEVTCTYVKGLRNVVEDFKYAKTHPVFKLFS